MEYFDILDENGNKTGKTKLREEVHRDGDWHRVAHIWVINRNEGAILLQRRCATKDSNPNMLDVSCGGHLSAGDDSLTGAVRELKEELDLDVDPSDLEFVKTLKKSSKYTDSFINNQFNDIYFLVTDKNIEDMKFLRFFMFHIKNLKKWFLISNLICFVMTRNLNYCFRGLMKSLIK